MLRAKRHQLHETINNYITNKMTINLDMFGPLMKKMIRSNMNGSLIITKKIKKMQEMKQKLEGPLAIGVTKPIH